MARIRSIHPGLFTDEAFMSASAHARLLIIGIWGEAWDDGVFEWKPLTLKAKLFPADNVDLGDLLEELERLEFVTRFDHDGRKYGAVRNFQRYQRPKKPNSSGVLPDRLARYVGKSDTGSEPVPNPCGTGTPKSSQMEDGGEEGGEEKQDQSPAQRSTTGVRGCAAPSDLELALRKAAGVEGVEVPSLRNTAPIAALIEDGFDLETAILPVIRSKAGTAFSTWGYFVQAIREARKAGTTPLAATPVKDPGVFVAGDSEQGRAWERHEVAAGRPAPKWTQSRAGVGRVMSSEWPPGHEAAA